MFYHAELKHLREWQAYTVQFRCPCVRVCLRVSVYFLKNVLLKVASCDREATENSTADV